MPKGYRLLTALTAVTGCVSLMVTGELNPMFMAAMPLVIAAYYRLYMGRPQATKETVNALSAVVVVLFPVDVFIISGDVVVAVAHLTLLFHAIKGFDVKEPWDTLQVLFMSLLQMLVASELTLSPVFAAVFLVFMAVMTVSISYSHLVREGGDDIRPFIKPIFAVTLMTALMTAAFFVSIPRFNRGLWGRSHTRGLKTGFSKNVRLGEFGELKLDPSVVMRVVPDENKDPSRVLYWRGITFEEYGKNAWQDKKTARRTIYGRGGVFDVDYAHGKRLERQEILLAPLDTDVLFAVRGAARIEMRSRYVYSDDSGALYAPAKSLGSLKYTVYSTDLPPEAKGPQTEYLQLPAGMERIAGLASRLAAGPTDARARVKKIESYLRSNYTYSLKTDTVPVGVNAVERFLFTAKRGWCEHYATAMTLMLRSVGIPARVVSGFVGGRYNRFGGYLIVRKSDAHTWVEAVVDKKWETFDPTPPSFLEEDAELFMYLDLLTMNWNRYVIGYGSFEQDVLMKRVSKGFSGFSKWSGLEGAGLEAAAYAAAAAAAIFLLLRFRRGRLKIDKTGRRYLQVRARILRGAPDASRMSRARGYRGVRGGGGETKTAAEVLAMAGEMDEERRARVAEFFDLYGKIRFGGERGRGAMDRYEELYRVIRGKFRFSFPPKNP
jgi:transglutaminase-like putative cysteine protease